MTLKQRLYSVEILVPFEMPALLDLLCQYPILEPVVTALTFGDLLNLSRVSSQYRAALHDFSIAEADFSWRDVYIGQHQTPLWEGLKSKALRTCMEPKHKANNHKVRSCRLCPRLICEACMIRDSYTNRNDNPFQNRIRSLCMGCTSQNRPYPRAFVGLLVQSNNFLTCRCTAKEGVLCGGCKASQNTKCVGESLRCFGEGCEAEVLGQGGARVCIWCDRHISRTLADSRREYDVRHLNARSFATYERVASPVEDWIWETLPAERPALLDLGDNTHSGAECPCGQGTAKSDVQHTCSARSLSS